MQNAKAKKLCVDFQSICLFIENFVFTIRCADINVENKENIISHHTNNVAGMWLRSLRMCTIKLDKRQMIVLEMIQFKDTKGHKHTHIRLDLSNILHDFSIIIFYYYYFLFHYIAICLTTTYSTQ